ncbi:hypothetical protein TSUD_158600 [Trifolium subterraneum]|uniref:Integrase catalytic domain-containing protein n=1 Tax=Trifolium subterraneum TaxID=3900 RepID=A0A2Z6P2A0_TRISU|nr:hypothetical protein TSUD_158600 [Trifolium subterraneum]
MASSPPRNIDELELCFDDRLTQMQLQRNSDVDELRTLLRAQAESSSQASTGRHGSDGPRRCAINFFSSKKPRQRRRCDWLLFILMIKHSGKIQDYVDQFELALTQQKRSQLMVLEVEDDESNEDPRVDAPVFKVVVGINSKLHSSVEVSHGSCSKPNFVADVVVLPLACCDLILGIQWLKYLGPILWDFEKLQMELTTKVPSFKLINNKSFAQAVQKGAELCFFIYADCSTFMLLTCHVMHTSDASVVIPPPIAALLIDYADIFEETSQLPLSCPGFDHKITLKEGITPFNLHPYRFSLVQKDVIDKLVHDMLDQGIVQHSTSPFASPTILVRKKDGLWRFCVDFRRLNELTIKDRFPIPLIEDLMDELHGSMVFSKLDMRSKCDFALAKVEYLGHFITHDGVSTDPAKIQVEFGKLAQPLTDLCKNDNFLSSAVGGHSGRDVTTSRVKSLFYWKGMSKDILNFVKNCGVCQKNKFDLAASPGLLQPLPIPNQVWTDISMDFIEGLPPSAGKHVIFVVVDRLKKYAHFMALAHPYTAVDVAQVFLDNVFKLHGLPESITSDRDSIFLSSFWNAFFKLQDKPTQWSKWLSLAEWWDNTNYHSSIHTTPFEIVYGQPPPIHLPYLPGSASTVIVDKSLMARDETIKLLKFHLLRAQNRMSQLADKHRSDRVFYVDRIGSVAYQLQLPLTAAIHNVFHVSQLKLCPNPHAQPVQHLPPDITTARRVPLAILDRKMVKRGRIATTKVLVQWNDLPTDKATWEFYYDLLKKFPDFHP